MHRHFASSAQLLRVLCTAGQHSLEGAWAASPYRKHDPALCEAEGGLVDECRALQQGAHQEGGDSRQDSVSQEPGAADAPVPEGRAGEAAQLPQGWALCDARGGCGNLHHHRALAGEPQVQPHPIPAPVLQARHQAAHPGKTACLCPLVCHLDARN